MTIAYWQWGKTQTPLFCPQQEQSAQQQQQRVSGSGVHTSQAVSLSRVVQFLTWFKRKKNIFTV